MTNQAITVRGIDHVVIRTEAIATLLQFYRDVLGCRLERHAEELGLYQLRAGSALIDLVDVDGPLGRKGGGPPRSDGRNMDHLCLQVEPWDEVAIRAYLAKAGVAAPAAEKRYGAKGFGPSIYIEDPDGNAIELKGPPTE
jgi:catechol 2,3-dioxygenase-like lactoylglutathione lyase family enzyme